MIINHPCLDTPLGKRQRMRSEQRDAQKWEWKGIERDKTERYRDVERSGEEKVNEVLRIKTDYFIIGARSGNKIPLDHISSVSGDIPVMCLFCCTIGFCWRSALLLYSTNHKRWL